VRKIRVCWRLSQKNSGTFCNAAAVDALRWLNDVFYVFFLVSWIFFWLEYWIRILVEHVS